MRWVALAVMCIAVAGVATTAATAWTASGPPLIVVTTPPTAPIATAIDDPIFLGPKQKPAYAMTRQAGATYVRLIVKWSSIAPKKLPLHPFKHSDPNSPYYHWSALDATVTAADLAHLTPILDIVGPPGWAYAVKRGAWTGGEPKLAELRAFATAIATRYNGAGHGAAHAFSVWNEANYTKNLFPQDATFYRSMVNQVAEAVHAVNPANLAVAGELAPVKNLASTTGRNHAIPPLVWMRTMLCLSNTTPIQRTCNTPAEFDVWAHHPYSDTGPFGKAKLVGGVELGDLPAMKRLLQAAERLKTISSAKPVQFWVTEFGWSSNPPNARGAPLTLEARWLAESIYQIWRSGASLATWFLLQDMQPGTPFQSGLYFRSPTLATARVKPLFQPFKFPFVAYLHGGGRVFVWGRDATSDVRVVTIEAAVSKGAAWRPVAQITSNSSGIFQASLPLKASYSYWLRAVAPGSGQSRPFALQVPPNENLSVIPFPPN